MNNINSKNYEENPIIQTDRISVFLNFDSEEVWKEIYREYQEQKYFEIVPEISFQYKAIISKPKKLLGTKRPSEIPSNNSASYEVNRKAGTFRVIIPKSLLRKESNQNVREIKRQISQSKKTPVSTKKIEPIESSGLFGDINAIDLDIEINRMENIVTERKITVRAF
jgi:hypothetical protein